MKRLLVNFFSFWCIIAVCISCFSRPTSTSMDERLSQSLENPVINGNFPDPTVILGHDGFYYAYATNSFRDGELIHIQVAKSLDLITWDVLGDALPEPPVWADKDFWAPHVLYDSALKTYFLYYSGESVDETIGKCMGVATSKNPQGPFVDKGEALLCGETFVEIDPMAFDDPVSGKKYLYWGSGHQPIKVRELADDRLDFKKGSSPQMILDTIGNTAPENFQKLVEGPWVTFRGGYYYLFYSGDNCCGPEAHYATMVARSDHPEGPYTTLAQSTDASNSVLIERHGRWIAIGHNSVIKDKSGQDWIAYHGIDTLDRSDGRVMLMHQLNWDEGWPKVKFE